MKVIVCNFGLANWAWGACRKNGTIAVMDDVRVHDFWKAGDQEAYIQAAREHLHAPHEDPVSRAVASRWYGYNDLLMETDGDLWIHRAEDSLWWTVSEGDEPTVEIVDEPRPRFGGPARAVLYQKPSTGWSDSDRKGRKLGWNSLHPKAKTFLQTLGTFSTLQPDNARYAETLIDGGDLSAWHSRPDWSAKLAAAKTKQATIFDERQKTIVRLAMTVMGTVAASGTVSLVIKKDKEMRFASQFQLEAYLGELIANNEMACALTGVEMQLDGGEDPERFVSLDRIDSDGHYERGNLQLVCRFANRWKSAMRDQEFRRLVDLVRAVPIGAASEGGEI